MLWHVMLNTLCTLSPPQVRYQMHSCEVTACALAGDADTVASAGIDGKVVLWSARTGFQLQVFTLHSSEVRSLTLNTGRLRGV